VKWKNMVYVVKVNQNNLKGTFKVKAIDAQSDIVKEGDAPVTP
jgi:hypothetical protein